VQNTFHQPSVQQHHRHYFVINDRNGGGLDDNDGNGYYELILDDESIHKGKQFGYQDDVSFDSRTGEVEDSD